jgi:hypothetical protein
VTETAAGSGRPPGARGILEAMSRENKVLRYAEFYDERDALER